MQHKMEMLIKAALPSGTSKKTWVWEKVCYPVGQVQGMQLELPKAVPMEASRCWGHWLVAGARVQILPLLPQGPGRRGRTRYGLICPEPGSAVVWYGCISARAWLRSRVQQDAPWHHPAQTLGDHPAHMGTSVGRSHPEREKKAPSTVAG